MKKKKILKLTKIRNLKQNLSTEVTINSSERERTERRNSSILSNNLNFNPNQLDFLTDVSKMKIFLNLPSIQNEVNTRYISTDNDIVNKNENYNINLMYENRSSQENDLNVKFEEFSIRLTCEEKTNLMRINKEISKIRFRINALRRIRLYGTKNGNIMNLLYKTSNLSNDNKNNIKTQDLNITNVSQLKSKIRRTDLNKRHLNTSIASSSYKKSSSIHENNEKKTLSTNNNQKANQLLYNTLEETVRKLTVVENMNFLMNSCLNVNVNLNPKKSNNQVNNGKSYKASVVIEEELMNLNYTMKHSSIEVLISNENKKEDEKDSQLHIKNKKDEKNVKDKKKKSITKIKQCSSPETKNGEVYKELITNTHNILNKYNMKENYNDMHSVVKDNDMKEMHKINKLGNISERVKGEIEFLKFQETNKQIETIQNTIRQSDIAYETNHEKRMKELNESMKKYNEKLSFLNYELEKTNKRLFELKTDKEAIEIMLENQKSLGNFYVFLPSNSITQPSPLSHNKVKSIVKTEEDEMIRQADKRKKVNGLTYKLGFLINQIKYGSFIKESLKNDIDNIVKKIVNMKKESKSISEILEAYYHYTLEKGDDTRDKGLSWIICSIWNLGMNIYMSYFPSYCDNKLIEYFFIRAHKEVELSKSESLLNELRELVRELRGREYRLQKKNKKKFSNKEVKDGVYEIRKIKKEKFDENIQNIRNIKNMNEIIRSIDNRNHVDHIDYITTNTYTSVYNSSIIDNKTVDYNRRKSILKKNLLLKIKIKERKKDILPLINNHPKITNEDEEISYVKLNKFFKAKTNLRLNDKFQFLMEYVEELERISKEIKDELIKMRQVEIDRITKEVLYNNYCKVYNVSIKNLLSCIVGERNVMSELKIFISKKKELFIHGSNLVNKEYERNNTEV